jgi:hypothetical protein
MAKFVAVTNISFFTCVGAMTPFILGPAVVAVGAGVLGTVAGTVGGFYITGLHNSDWSDRTERRTYKADNGHVIIADPTY